MATIFTLDTFFVRRVAPNEDEEFRRATSLAAELGTDQTDEPRSVWAGSSYGSRLTEIRRTMPGGTLALTAEAQRIVDKHAIGGNVTAAGDDLRIGINIMLTREGLIRG